MASRFVVAGGAEFRASPAGLAAIVGATVCWSLGSVPSTRLDVPEGPRPFAAERLGGGVVLLAPSSASGEAWTMPWDAPPRALAGSYAYVNPAVALVVGAVLGGETVAPQTLVALPVILAAVAILMGGRR